MARTRRITMAVVMIAAAMLAGGGVASAAGGNGASLCSLSDGQFSAGTMISGFAKERAFSGQQNPGRVDGAADPIVASLCNPRRAGG
jgi:hypothetical protein